MVEKLMVIAGVVMMLYGACSPIEAELEYEEWCAAAPCPVYE